MRGFGADQTGFVEEQMHAVGHLRADGEPMFRAIGVDHHALGVFTGEQGVVGADTFDELAVARAAGIGDDNAVKRAFFGSGAGHSDGGGHRVPLVIPAQAGIQFHTF